MLTKVITNREPDDARKIAADMVTAAMDLDSGIIVPAGVKS